MREGNKCNFWGAGNRRKLSASWLPVICLIVSCTAILAGEPEWQRNRSEPFSYKIANQKNLSVESVGGRHIITGKGGFNLTLLPEQGPFWNMESVSLLGLMIKNTGTIEMTLYSSLENANATPWSSSAY